MSYLTMNDLAQEVITKVGLVTGTAVQTYTEPQVFLELRNTFDMLFRKRDWSHLTTDTVVELDGVSGTPVDDLSELIRDTAHILNIERHSDNVPVTRPTSTEYLNVTGSSALYWKERPWIDNSAAEKVITIYPQTATTAVRIKHKVRPLLMDSKDIVPFSRDLMVYGAAWMLLSTDGINPGNAMLCQGLYEDTYATIIEEQGKAPLGKARRVTNGQFVVSGTQ